MTKPRIINGVPECPCCGSLGIYVDGILWSCSAAPFYQFEADCEVEVEREKFFIQKKIRSGGTVELAHIPRQQTVIARLSETL